MTTKKLRESTGGAFTTRGSIFLRVTVGPQKRKAVRLPWVTPAQWARHDAGAERCECVACDRARLVQSYVTRLREAGKVDFIEKIVEVGADATTPAELADLAAAVDGIAGGAIVKKSPTSNVMTFRKFGERWTSGELHRLYRDHVREKRSATEDAGRLEKYVYPVVGDKPIAAFTLRDAQDVLRRVPSSIRSSTRRQIAQLMVRICNLAVYPCELLEVSPLPKGFLPRVKCRIGGYLYPADDRALLGHVDGIPLANRLLYGFLAREGCRKEEALSLTWLDLDLKHGAVRLDENKTDDPRAWALDPGVVIALRWWRENRAKGVPDDAHVFVDVDDVQRLADAFRDHLALAGVKRPELFETNDVRRQINVHGLRATFVTLSLANGRSEAWVQDRTGHRSSSMVNRYRRVARTVAELGLGALDPLYLVLPEIGPDAAAKHGSGGAERPRASSKTSDIPPNVADSGDHGVLEIMCTGNRTGGSNPLLSADLATKSAKDGEGLLPRSAAANTAADDPVEGALAKALDAAAAAGRFDVVAQLAKEIEARRLARAENVIPIGGRKRRES